jgi:hypothetical protein
MVHHLACRVDPLDIPCHFSGLYEYFILFQNILENLHKLSFTSMSGVQAKISVFCCFKGPVSRGVGLYLILKIALAINQEH